VIRDRAALLLARDLVAILRPQDAGSGELIAMVATKAQLAVINDEAAAERERKVVNIRGRS
jgi:hypothetical protein